MLEYIYIYIYIFGRSVAGGETMVVGYAKSLLYVGGTMRTVV